MSKRQPVFTQVCGAPQHGKSYFTNKKIQLSKRRTIIIDNSQREELWLQYPTISLLDKDDVKNFTGIRYTCLRWYENRANDLKKSAPELLFELIDKNCNDLQIVFDDSYPYIKSAISQDMHFRNFMANRRQRGIDIWNINHSIRQIPLAFIPYIQFLVLFYVADSADTASKRLETDLVKKPIQELQTIKASMKSDNDKRKYTNKIIRLQ